ncbi:S8 family serine peptidase [Fulvivirga maritima]|uniref:S8 family peptidase n=1 Tax=Fulvivirga maritima TaxID=2904247 RepID=UPI001F31DFA4|nr:S8 family serine peptidase [Fulvivirga maritima]UII29178.1 S8 family serine peptidase [Fulvivirga maritima]
MKINGQLPVLSSRKTIVAILDTGIQTHPDLEKAVIEQKNFVSANDGVNSPWHGTFMAGIIGGRTALTRGVKGLASNCEILDYKVLKDTGSTDMDAVKKALEYILHGGGPQPDIINMSFSVRPGVIDSLIAEITAKGILVVGAGGRDNLFKDNNCSFLAKIPGVISVGAAESVYLSNRQSKYPEQIDFVYHNMKQWSTYTSPSFYYQDQGDSIYTAITSGLLAREISFDDQADALSLLKQKAFNISEFNPETLKIYKL